MVYMDIVSGMVYMLNMNDASVCVFALNPKP